MNIANSINIYTKIYTYNICDENNSKIKMTQQTQYDSMVMLLAKLLCCISYFRISIFDPVFQTVQMEGSYHFLSYKD